MTVRVSKPAFNIREALNSLRRKIGIKGGELMAADTAADAYAVLNPTMFRNRLINGDMRIWQRGTGTFVNGNYTADRWHIGQYQSTGISATFQNATGLVNSPYAVRLQRPNGTVGANALWLNQPIESMNSRDLAGNQITLSFLVRTGANFSGATVDYGTCYQAADSSTDYGMDYNYFRNTVNQKLVSTVIGPSSDWKYITVTHTVPSPCYQVGVFISFTPTGTAGANDWIEVTNVQLEKGSVATPFEFRPYGTELALCQRYFQKSFPTDTAPAQNSGISTIGGNCLGGGFGTITTVRFGVSMRAQPTITGYNPSNTNGLIRNGSANADIQYVGIGSNYTNGFIFYPYGANHDSGVGSYQWYWNWTASAEL